MIKSRINLESIVECCGKLLDQMHKKNAGWFEVENSLYNIVAFKLFGYGLNTFKSIYYLLPHTIYEQASALYRTLWETGVNLEWIALKPELRAERFLAYTAVEYKRFLEGRLRMATRKKNLDMASALRHQIAAFQKTLAPQLTQFSYNDKAGRKKTLSRFSAPSLDNIVRELGDEWVDEYDHDYKLSCLYTHGAPGAVLFPLYDTENHDIDKALSTERTCNIGASAIEVMSRIYRRWLSCRHIEDEIFIKELQRHVLSAKSA